MTFFLTILSTLVMFFSLNGGDHTQFIRIANSSTFEVSLIYFNSRDHSERIVIKPDEYFIRKYYSPVTVSIESHKHNRAVSLEQVATHTFNKAGTYTLLGDSFNDFDYEYRENV